MAKGMGAEEVPPTMVLAWPGDGADPCCGRGTPRPAGQPGMVPASCVSLLAFSAKGFLGQESWVMRGDGACEGDAEAWGAAGAWNFFLARYPV